jgi:hypothetical protein
MLCFVYRGLICRAGGGRVPARRVGGGGVETALIYRMYGEVGGGGRHNPKKHTHKPAL